MSTRINRWPRRLSGLGWLFLISLAAGIFFSASVVLPDTAQARSDAPALELNDSQSIGQTFVALHPNLSAVRITLALIDTPLIAAGELVVHLRASPQSNSDLASARYDLREYHANDPVRFAFNPLPDSSGKSYYLLIEAGASARVSVWATHFDSYTQGSCFKAGVPSKGDLAFATEYTYRAWQMLPDMADSLLRDGWRIVPLLALIGLPGLLLLAFVQPAGNPIGVADLIASLSVSLAFWPLLLLWTTTLGFRVDWGLLVAILSVLSLALAALSVRKRLHTALWRGMHADGALALGLLTVFGLILALRFVEIKDVALPLWVDSVHHTLLTRLIAEQGRLPPNLEPYIASDRLTYHFGFHVFSALWSVLTGMPAEQSILWLGQWLNALAALSLFPLTYRWTGSRLAGFAAVIVVGLVSSMPAYYVTWGRYTQLMGLVILPAALLAFSSVLKPVNSRGALVICSVLAAGLFVTHYRVMVFWLAYVVVGFLVVVCQARRGIRVALRVLARVALLGATASLLVLPWLLRLAQAYIFPLDLVGIRLFSASVDNGFPFDLYRASPDLALIALAALGVLAGWWRMRRLTVTLTVWVALCLVSVNLSLIGLWATWIINTFSAAIAGYLPLAVLIGILVAVVTSSDFSLRLRLKPAETRRWVLAGLIVLGAWGARGMLSVVNPVTVLATPADVEALAWIRNNTAGDALFFVNGRQWQSNIYAGTDGGYWIPLLANRRSTLPAALYSFSGAERRADVDGFYDLLQTTADPESAQFLGALRKRGVTHAFIGAKGGPLALEALLSSPHYREVYSNGAAYVFEVLY
jgi:hypothetical protein